MTIQDVNGTRHQVQLILWDEVPGQPDAVRVVVQSDWLQLSVDSEVGFFDALTQIRSVIEPRGYRIHCYGAAAGFYPSFMSATMGDGGRVYRLTPGRPARTEDLVDIFDWDEECRVASLAEQLAFYQQWLSSLG